MPNFFAFFLVLIACLVGCTTIVSPSGTETGNSMGGKDFFPVSHLSFDLLPNDAVVSDSIDANLTKGVSIYVHPNAQYELSFDKDESVEQVPNLQLFRVYWDKRASSYAMTRVRDLTPEEKDGRYVYSFVCEESEISVWLTSLNDGKKFYSGKTKNVHLKASGAYSDHLSLNLIVAGEVDDLDVSVEEFAKMLKDGFDKYYTSISVDTVYIRYANEHPELGKKYPANKPWIAGASSDDDLLTDLGGWPEDGVYSALDVVLVHSFAVSGMLGLSSAFGANLGGGTGSTIVVANHDYLGDIESVVPAESMIFTALHETGHFFGLRHTTATVMDQETMDDYSVFDDGFDDTPYCFQGEAIKLNGMPVAKVMADVKYPHRISLPRYRFSMELSECPDASNIMFPTNTDYEDVSFSKQQLELVRENLTLMPH